MGDYHRVRWRALQEASADCIVYAADLGANDTLYKWETTKQEDNYFLLSFKTPDQFDWRRISRLVKIITSKNIETICIAGYGRLEYILLILYSRLSGKKVILFAESWYPSSIFIDKIKSLFLRWSCSGFLVSGKRAFNHFTQRLKVSEIKMRIGYSVVDNIHFDLPVHFDLSGRRKTLLCVARFSPEKNLALLLDAFIQSNLIGKGWEMNLIGGGALKEVLDVRIKNQPIKLLDWQSYDVLPHFYHSASVFILPSSFEPWGLVVNEAMAASLPIVLSEQVGCLPDLLTTQNGWSFECNDSNELVELLNKISEKSIEELYEMGGHSKLIISYYSPKLFAANVRSLIEESAK